MKANCWCIGVAAMLLVSTTVFGVIVTDDDWYGDEGGAGDVIGDEESSSADVFVNGNDPSGWAGAEGWESLQTTVGGDCNWSCYASTYAYVNAEWVSGISVNAYAYASASASAGSHGSAYPDDAEVHLTSTGSDYAADSDYDYDTNYFSAYTGCSGSHTVLVSAVVGSGSGSIAFADAYAKGDVEMSEN